MCSLRSAVVAFSLMLSVNWSTSFQVTDFNLPDLPGPLDNGRVHTLSPTPPNMSNDDEQAPLRPEHSTASPSFRLSDRQFERLVGSILDNARQNNDSRIRDHCKLSYIGFFDPTADDKTTTNGSVYNNCQIGVCEQFNHLLGFLTLCRCEPILFDMYRYM
jgi:hypothetical protein